MDAKLNHSELSALFARQAGMSAAKAEAFTKAFFDIIIEGLESDGSVKINGLGTFKVTDVASRESVDVNTGEKIEIKGHKKLTFLPADTLKESVNQPFAMFEPVEIDDSYVDGEEDDATPEDNDSAESIKEEALEDAVAEETLVVEEKAEEGETSCSETQVDENATTMSEEPAQEVAAESVEKEKQPEAEPTQGDDNIEKKKRKSWLLPLLFVVIIASGYFVYSTTQNGKSVAVPTAPAAKIFVPAAELVPATKIDSTAVTEEAPYTFTLIDELANKNVASVGVGDTLLYYADGTIEKHIVTEDETLTRIALKYYGDKRLWPYIVQHNDLRNPNGLAKGMELAIPRLKPVKNNEER